MLKSCWLSLFAATLCAAEPPLDPLTQWGQWRGPLASGVAPQAHPPLTWAEGKNIRWKVEVPGSGLSTPIIWGDRVYLLTARPDAPPGSPPPEAPKPSPADQPAANQQASPAPSSDPAASPRPREGRRGRSEGRSGGGLGGQGGMRPETPTEPYRFIVVALDRGTGRTIWETTVARAVPHEGHHEDGSFAAASPITDGKRIFAHFGSRGLYCLDLDGNVVWQKDLGRMQTRNGFGEGSSPALIGDTLVVNWDQEAGSFIVALDAATGAERWRKPREEPTSWATPLAVRDGERRTVVVSGTNRVRAYDLADGTLVWECGGLGANCIPSPVTDGGLVFAMSGHRDPALLAIRYADAHGDLTKADAVSWRLTGEGPPYVSSPLLYGDMLYFLQKNTAILGCYDARSGTQHFKERLEKIDGVYASPIGAEDRIYVVGRNGTTCVLKRGPKFEVLAVNELDDHFDASPAAAGKELLLRGKKYLYCIAEE